MKKTIKIMILAMAVSLIFTQALVFGGGQQDDAAAASETEKQYVIKLAHGVTTTDPLQPAAEKFKELAESYTNGRVRVELYPNGQLGDEQEIVQSLRSGAIEMGIVYTGNAQSLAPSISVL